MDNFIIQKEPDFEHLELESNENRLYSAIVKYNNVKYAMLGMLQNPPDEFKDVVFRRTQHMKFIKSIRIRSVYSP